MKLFTFTQTRVHDFYILTRHCNHALSNVEDAYWLTHFKDKNLTRTSNSACLQDQLAGLRNGHEVTSSIRMSHCQRLVFIDKADECWKHRTTAANDVAESN